MKYLNLGCGNRFLPQWTNIDFVSQSEGVKAYNLINGIPLNSDTYDAVYHSHVLEHFLKPDGYFFLKECYRVLKKGGILRVVVPDLEQIAKEYLKYLEAAKNGNQQAKDRYQWVMLEMYDQTVRNSSGGDMLKYWKQANIPEEAYIASRIGQEFFAVKTKLQQAGIVTPPKPRGNSPFQRLINWKTYRDKLLLWLSGDPNLFKHLAIGRFRTGGEIHQWMYDEFSLSELLKNIGFKSVLKVDAFSSQIPNWKEHQWLDVESEQVRKPDSLFIEAVK